MSEFPDTRSTLIAQVRSRENHEAWTQFVTLYRPAIYRMARKRGMQDADAQDLVQAVLIRVLGAIHRWERTESSVGFRHWLSRVAKNAILTALTRAAKDAGIGGTDVQELLNEQPEVDPDIEQDFALEFLREKYHRAAATVQTDVSAQTWRAFELSVVEGMPCCEVAELLGMTIGTIYAARSRVMRRLRDQVERLEGDKQ
jgi:RNA polymerase sigma-70 factor (ECF subfamily)